MPAPGLGAEGRAATLAGMLSAPLVGRSVLVAGADAGVIAFEAERLGASRVVAGLDRLDLQRTQREAARRGSRVEFVLLHTEPGPPPGRFDHVLLLDVLNRLRNPLGALDRWIGICEDSLVLTLNTPFPTSIPLVSPLLQRIPAVHVGACGRSRGARRPFSLTQASIHALLKKHRQDFAQVDVRVGESRTGLLVRARKRRIGELLLIAGVNAVGKSTLLAELMEGRHREITQKLGIDLSRRWRFANYYKLWKSTEPWVGRMMLQYNLSKPLIDGSLHRPEAGLEDVIQSSDRVAVATLWHPPDALRHRYETERLGLASRVPGTRARRKASALLALYRDPHRFEALYHAWFAFVRRHTAASYVILQEPSYRICTVAEWERACGRATEELPRVGTPALATAPAR